MKNATSRNSSFSYLKKDYRKHFTEFFLFFVLLKRQFSRVSETASTTLYKGRRACRVPVQDTNIARLGKCGWEQPEDELGVDSTRTDFEAL